MENEPDGCETDWLIALGQAAALFDRERDARVPAIFHALRIAIHRMKLAGADEQQLRPLTALLDDLDRLNHGRPANLLRPRKGFSAIWPDRHQGSFVVRQAIAIEVQEILFRELGSKRGVRRKAEERAVRLLRKHGYKSHMGKPITKDMLRQWRSQATDAGEQSTQLRECLKDLRGALPQQARNAKDETIAEELLSRFADHPSFELS